MYHFHLAASPTHSCDHRAGPTLGISCMKWFRLIAFSVLVAAGLPPASANPRVFPANSFQVLLEAAQDPYLTVNGETVQMSAATLIFGPTNTTLVRGALQPGVWVQLQFDSQCTVRRIWVLNSDEVVAPPVSGQWYQDHFNQPSCNHQ